MPTGWRSSTTRVVTSARELTLALCVDHVLSRQKGAVVVNGSTSRTTADLAAKYGCRFIGRTSAKRMWLPGCARSGR